MISNTFWSHLTYIDIINYALTSLFLPSVIFLISFNSETDDQSFRICNLLYYDHWVTPLNGYTVPHCGLLHLNRRVNGAELSSKTWSIYRIPIRF